MNDKPTLRGNFHKIGSLLFEITLASGYLKDSIEEAVSKDSPQFKRIKQALDDIEKAAMDIDSLIQAVKEYTYKRIDPDSVLS